jgi:hypothetical protein
MVIFCCDLIDWNFVGLFNEPGYINIDDPYKEPSLIFANDRHKGLNMMTHSGETGPYSTIQKNYKPLFSVWLLFYVIVLGRWIYRNEYFAWETANRKGTKTNKFWTI